MDIIHWTVGLSSAPGTVDIMGIRKDTGVVIRTSPLTVSVSPHIMMTRSGTLYKLDGPMDLNKPALSEHDKVSSGILATFNIYLHWRPTRTLIVF